MGLFKLVHDIMGIDGRKVSSSVKSSMKAVESQRKRLRNCEKVRKMRC